nr:Topoisomerase I [Synechococcus elongatus PCC 7942 = FACHB-805]
MPKLVIVESPTKARTIRNYLPKDYRVEASMGHVRDLPQSASDIPTELKGEKWSNLGVDVENNFAPLYIVPKDKKKIVKTLKDALKDADELILATDEDREGKVISWHLLQLLQPRCPRSAWSFDEITQEAIQAAHEKLSGCRSAALVHAQETSQDSRSLGGLHPVGPALEKNCLGPIAGRVQSVAVRLLVQRERARRAFRQGSYWDLKAQLTVEAGQFEAKLWTLAGQRLATGNDFDESTGQIIAGRQVCLLDQQEAEALPIRRPDPALASKVAEEKPTHCANQRPPFTTSTLQQESNRKLRLSARETMRVAQSLYERGFITYMRTDSVHLSQQAIEAARSCVEQMYGKNYLSPQPRQFTTKSKNAQEAHEAIRPAGNTFRLPQETGLSGAEFAVYDLIWKRTIASQMAEARQTMLSVLLEVDNAEFAPVASGSISRASSALSVEGSDDPDAALEDPRNSAAGVEGCGSPHLSGTGRESVMKPQPPARYTEASLVKMLENEGIGRPSTYASIIGTIVDRGYAQLVSNTLTPTFTAFAVTALLEQHFPDLVDTSFSARMEQSLDDISNGEVDWLPYLSQFYRGDRGWKNRSNFAKVKLIRLPLAQSRWRDCPPKSVLVVLALTRAEADGEPIKANLPKELTPADLDVQRVEHYCGKKPKGRTNWEHILKPTSRFTCLRVPTVPTSNLGQPPRKNPSEAGFFAKGMSLETISLEQAVGLLSLPRTLGEHPETGRRIQAGLGRFGPYVVCDLGGGEKDYRSLKADDDVLTIDLDRALELLAQPKKSRGRGKEPIRRLASILMTKPPFKFLRVLRSLPQTWQGQCRCPRMRSRRRSAWKQQLQP